MIADTQWMLASWMLGCAIARRTGSVTWERMSVPFLFAGVQGTSWAISRSVAAGESSEVSMDRRENAEESQLEKLDSRERRQGSASP